MTLQFLIPRIVLALILGVSAVFAYIESVYYSEHSSLIGERAGSIMTWVWVFRIASFSAAIGFIIVLISFFRK
ncbi:MAG TPA: hypothetical protein VIX80_04345 [Candidatus Kapabacteria bacterium]